MKVLVQRVKEASVSVDGSIIGQINRGLLVFLGINQGDNEAICEKMLQKVLAYRMFSDDEGRMNLNVQQVEGELLIVSQFTLVANTNKGLRPSFSSAGSPDKSRELYETFISLAKKSSVSVSVGQFGADMQVSLVNDGPVTFMLEL